MSLEKGQRRLVVEWEVCWPRSLKAACSCSRDTHRRAVHRQHEYVSVPRADAAPGLHPSTDPVSVARARRWTAADLFRRSYDLDGLLPGTRTRFTCGPRGAVKIPFAAGPTSATIHLGVRVFNAARQFAGLRAISTSGIGKAPAIGRIRPLTTWSYTTRDIGHANNIDGEVANTIDIALPSD